MGIINIDKKSTKKVTSFGWWSIIKTIIQFGSYLMIVIEGIQLIINKIEEKDGVKGEEFPGRMQE